MAEEQAKRTETASWPFVTIGVFTVVVIAALFVVGAVAVATYMSAAPPSEYDPARDGGYWHDSGHEWRYWSQPETGGHEREAPARPQA